MNKQFIIKYLFTLTKYILIPLAIITSFLFGYQTLTILYGGVGYGGVAYGWGKQGIAGIPLEFLLITITYYLLFFILKDNRYRHFLALLPIIGFYVFYDYYFISFGKVFKICDFSELPELIDVLPFWQMVLYITILLHIFFIIVVNLNKLWYRYLLPLVIIISITLIIAIKPLWYLDGLVKPIAAFGDSPWSDQNTAQNGYLTSLLYFEGMMANSKSIAKEIYGDGVAYEKSQEQLTQFLKEKSRARNIHIIVLESFFNPAFFKKIAYNAPIYAKNFSTLLGNNESSVISPVFGGHTAQAEFEILCGVPALHKYSSIEFNSFTGENVFCVPQLLKNTGYRVIASNSYKPSFFNAINAYKGIGFDEIYFPRQYTPKSNTYLSLVDNTKFIFDGDLLPQNLEFVKKHLQQDKPAPLFNYLLGVYGHFPFDMDEKRHPMRIKASDNKKMLNSEFQRAVNQIYYRSEALANYLQQLIKLDPNSLIIVMGDHVPKLDGTPFYKAMGWRSNYNDIEDGIHRPSAFYIANGQFVKKDDLHQYDMMTMMFDYLTEQQYCKAYPCQRNNELLEYQYNMDMARALK
jgi:phosphoglycerol transferase MdoB-like AlkP superfamily enzyme